MAKKQFDWKYWAELRSKSLKRKPLKRTGIKKKYRPKKNKIEGLFEFYEEAIATCNWLCRECGEYVYSADMDFQLACIAHLLPKEYFPSVAKNILNIMCLGGTCGCHRKYDKSWASARKMKIWSEAEFIIVKFLIPLLPPNEYKKLPDFLKELYENRGS